MKTIINTSSQKQIPVSFMKPQIRKVLIIDDDLDLLDSVKYQIEASCENIKCDRVADAYEALLAICDKSYDYVIVDFRLPGLSGANLLQEIDHHIERDPLLAESGRFTKRIPVILMSGQDVELPKNFELTHFDMMGVISKKDLSQFLDERFVS